MRADLKRKMERTKFCIEKTFEWMQANDIEVNGRDAMASVHACMLSFCDRMYDRISEGECGEEELRPFAAMILTAAIVDTVNKDEGADNITLGSERADFDETIRRKARAEVDEMNDDL